MNGRQFISGVSFDAETMQALGEAFDYVCDALSEQGQSETLQEIIALRVFEVA